MSGDKRIQDAMSDLQLDIDTQDVWDAIEPQLPRKKRKKRLLLWLLLSAGAGLMIWAIQYSLQKETVPDVRHTPNVEVVDRTHNPQQSDCSEANAIKYVDHSKTSTIYRKKPDQIFVQNNHTIPSTEYQTKEVTRTANDIEHIKIQRKNNQHIQPVSPSRTTSSNMERLNIEDTSTIERQTVFIQDIDRLSSLVIGQATLPNVAPYQDVGYSWIYGMSIGYGKEWFPNEYEVNPVDGAYNSQYEESKLGIHGSLNFGKMYRNGWFWLSRVGVNYQVSEFDRVFKGQIEKSKYNGVTSIDINTAGIKQVQTGTIHIYNVYDLSILRYRHELRGNVYAQVGKNVFPHLDFIVAPDLGFGIGTSLYTEGYVLDRSSLGVSDSKSLGNDVMATDISLAAGLRLGLKRSGYMAYIRPYYTKGITPKIRTNDYTVASSRAGVELGLLFKIKK